MYNPMLSAITDIPNANTSTSEPLSARVMIESEEIIGVINNFSVTYYIQKKSIINNAN